MTKYIPTEDPRVVLVCDDYYQNCRPMRLAELPLGEQGRPNIMPQTADHASGRTSHILLPTEQKAGTRVPSQDARQPQWPNFRGTPQLIGTSTSGRVKVYVDLQLEQQGRQNAQDLFNDADRVVRANDAIFGTSAGSTNVIVWALNGSTNGLGGADHWGCDFATGGDIEVCASFGNSMRVSGLFEAELSECCMNGNLCGVSTGEALSRWCAMVISNNALPEYVTAPRWFQAGMLNWVDQTYPSDGDEENSTGCGMAFISWLLKQGHSLGQIAQMMVLLGDSGTLAQLYAKLTGEQHGNAWSKFHSAVQALANGVNDDDPFGGAPQARIADVTPVTVELAGKVFSAILADLNAGRHDHEILASIRAAMASADHVQAAGSATCSAGKSHPLTPSTKPS